MWRHSLLIASFIMLSAFFGPEQTKHPLGDVITFTSEPTQYLLKSEGDEKRVHAITGEATASGLVKMTPQKCLNDGILNWRWKVLKAHPKVDIESKEHEDFAASVHLIYSEHEGSDFFKNDFHMLSYVWAAQNDPIGAVLNTPKNRHGTQKRILLQNKQSPLQQWQTESRNVQNDLIKLFGERPPYPLRALMLFTDSDQTGKRAEAIYQMDCF